MFRLLLVLAVIFVTGVPCWAQEIDMGDLPVCNYPTLLANPGHTLSDIAWLGECISSEPSPNILNQDPCDDGVTFLDIPWTPCELVQVRVQVTGGPIYPLYRAQGGRLYLNAWKDGNMDYDFCDVLCDGRAAEWIIQDVVVTPGTAVYSFVDPGITTIGVYEGVLRFRLTSQPVGPYGFGMVDTAACPGMACGTFAYDHLGEVEDYIIPDLQLFVDLDRFDAIAGDETVTLSWETFAENSIDGFEIERDGARIGHISATGSGPAGGSYHFVDDGLVNGQSYSYTLLSVDIAGNRQVLQTASAIPIEPAAAVSEYALYQNWPNPFNPMTTIRFDLVESGHVTLKVYNPVGQEVASMIDESMSPGSHTIMFNGAQLPSGMYFYRLQVNNFVAEHKMLLMK